MKACTIKSDCGSFPAIVGNAGRTFTPFVRIESPTQGPFIKKYRLTNADMEKYSRPLLKGIDPYPLKTACNHMLRIGRAHGITKAAKALLMEAKSAG